MNAEVYSAIAACVSAVAALAALYISWRVAKNGREQAARNSKMDAKQLALEKIHYFTEMVEPKTKDRSKPYLPTDLMSRLEAFATLLTDNDLIDEQIVFDAVGKKFCKYCTEAKSENPARYETHSNMGPGSNPDVCKVTPRIGYRFGFRLLPAQNKSRQSRNPNQSPIFL